MRLPVALKTAFATAALVPVMPVSPTPWATMGVVEHDRLTLTYDKLLQLSQHLNIRMSELFAEGADAAEAAVTARRSIGDP